MRPKERIGESAEAVNEEVVGFSEAKIMSFPVGSAERRFWGNALVDYRSGDAKLLADLLRKEADKNDADAERAKVFLEILHPKQQAQINEQEPGPEAGGERRLRKRVLDLYDEAIGISDEVARIFWDNVSGGDQYHFEELLTGGQRWTEQGLQHLEGTIGDFIETGKRLSRAQEGSTERDHLREELIEKAKRI